MPVTPLKTIAFVALAALAADPCQAAATVTSVANAASYTPRGFANAGVSQGGMLVAFGSDLGPSPLVIVNQFPLVTTLAGTTVKVTVGGQTIDCYMIYTFASQVAAIVPSRTPLGDGTLTITYSGQSATSPISIVRNSFGIFTRNQAGSGPAIVQNVYTESNRPVNAVNESLNPREIGIIWGTGKGAVAADEVNMPVPGDNRAGVEVLVGGKVANLLYAGRSGCCAGIDQIVFEVPEGVEGCYVPLIVRINGVVSNFTSISIARTGRVCSDPSGFSSSDLENLTGSGTLTFGTISLSRSAFKLSVPGVGTLDSKNDSGTAQFLRIEGPKFLASSGLGLATPFLGSCSVFQGVLQTTGGYTDPIRFEGLDAGPFITVSSSVGSKPMTPVQGVKGSYSGDLGGGAAIPGIPIPVTPGVLENNVNVDNGAGGADIGGFRVQQAIGLALNWTNQDAITNIPRSSDLLITWTGGNAGSEYVIMTGNSSSGTTVGSLYGGFVCVERVAAGRFSIPSYALSALPPSATVQGAPAGFLFVGTQSLNPTRFTAPRLDIGILTTSSTFMKNVSYQ